MPFRGVRDPAKYYAEVCGCTASAPKGSGPGLSVLQVDFFHNKLRGHAMIYKLVKLAVARLAIACAVFFAYWAVLSVWGRVFG